jgi:acetyl-CoA carboxylase biotin carboxyl carrier protein
LRGKEKGRKFAPVAYFPSSGKRMSDQVQQQPLASEQTPEDKSSEQRGGRRNDRERRGRRHQQQQHQPRRPEASLNMEELRDLVELIAEHGFTDFELEREGFRVRLRRELPPQSAPAPSSNAPASAPTAQVANLQSPPTPVVSSGAATTSQGHQPPTAATSAQGEKSDGGAASEDEDLHIITSPIVGTFYRSPSATADPFVRLGSAVDPVTIVCIIEAMKLMNEILAETSGEVAKIYVENGQPVEYGQPLFGVKAWNK